MSCESSSSSSSVKLPGAYSKSCRYPAGESFYAERDGIIPPNIDLALVNHFPNVAEVLLGSGIGKVIKIASIMGQPKYITDANIHMMNKPFKLKIDAR